MPATDVFAHMQKKSTQTKIHITRKSKKKWNDEVAEE